MPLILLDSIPNYARSKLRHDLLSKTGSWIMNSQRLANVRNRMLRWIADHSENGCVEKIVRETLLIRDEFYVGRRFYTESHRAVWFIEEDQLKIYDAADRLLCVLACGELDPILDEPGVIKMPQPTANQHSSDAQIRRAA